VLQLLRRIAAVEKRGLKQRVAREIALDAGGVDLAAGLVLQVLVAADVVGVGVRVVDGGQVPAVGVEDLAHLAPGLLVVAAVDQADVFLIQPEEADVGGALDVIRPLGKLYQFVHSGIPSVTFLYRHPIMLCYFFVLSSYQFFRLFVMSFYHVLLLLCIVILSYFPAKHKRPADSRAPAYLICIWRRWPPHSSFRCFCRYTAACPPLR